MEAETTQKDIPGSDSGTRTAAYTAQNSTPQWGGAADPLHDMGGYADCCGASEADEACPYRPPTAEEVAKFSRKQGAQA